jgi:lipopolysaccharide transport system permease protein
MTLDTVETRDPQVAVAVQEAAEAAVEVHRELPVTRIRPARGWLHVNVRELWDYRELAYLLAWRDVTVRYKQTVGGAAWAIIQPFMTMVAFSIFFGHLAKVPSDGVPYPIFSYTALLPWNYFAQALQRSSQSLVNSTSLITKVYFPRLLLPIASVLPPLFDFAIAFIVLLGMMVWYQIVPTPGIVLLPLFILLALMCALGVGLWVSALNVDYRDFGNLLPFLIQVWMLATPVAYSSSLLSEPWRTLYSLNPMVGVIDGFRWALLGTGEPAVPIALSMIISTTLLITGALYYRRTERTFADVV